MDIIDQLAAAARKCEVEQDPTELEKLILTLQQRRNDYEAILRTSALPIVQEDTAQSVQKEVKEGYEKFQGNAMKYAGHLLEEIGKKTG